MGSNLEFVSVGLVEITGLRGPAQRVIGPMFAGYTQEDAGLDMGDSAITETYGVGGFAMAAAPDNCPISWRNSGRSIELFKRNAGNYYERKIPMSRFLF